MSKILLYSPKKNKANVIDEYSTLYPATISASASGKSKGALLVSANIEIRNRKHKGIRGKKYQFFCCLSTILIRLNVPEHIITGNIINPIEIS